jgi:hypothetical protein
VATSSAWGELFTWGCPPERAKPACEGWKPSCALSDTRSSRSGFTAACTSKSGCVALDGETLLVNPAWLDTEALFGVRLVHVPREEPSGANVLRLPGVVLVSGAFPRTADLVKDLGYPAVVLDVSELHKAEAGLTCMSLVFEEACLAVFQSLNLIL